MAKKRQNKINQKNYKFYIYSSSQNKIIEGFQYKTDAIERQKERNDKNRTKVYAKLHLVSRLQLNPELNSSWGTERKNKVPAKNKQNIFTKAKEIRKKGEDWQKAIQRAKKLMK